MFWSSNLLSGSVLVAVGGQDDQRIANSERFNDKHYNDNTIATIHVRKIEQTKYACAANNARCRMHFKFRYIARAFTKTSNGLTLFKFGKLFQPTGDRGCSKENLNSGRGSSFICSLKEPIQMGTNMAAGYQQKHRSLSFPTKAWIYLSRNSKTLK